ncbi:MAG: hypothetical protein ACD_20C00198G0001, partial [uncultured bacterium]
MVNSLGNIPLDPLKQLNPTTTVAQNPLATPATTNDQSIFGQAQNQPTLTNLAEPAVNQATTL